LKLNIFWKQDILMYKQKVLLFLETYTYLKDFLMTYIQLSKEAVRTIVHSPLSVLVKT